MEKHKIHFRSAEKGGFLNLRREKGGIQGWRETMDARMNFLYMHIHEKTMDMNCPGQRGFLIYQ
jgi:hypothetical protein